MSDCACCDIMRGIWGPTDVLAFGVALGAALGQAGVRERLCSEHRTRYVMAMLQATVRLLEIDAAPTGGTER